MKSGLQVSRRTMAGAAAMLVVLVAAPRMVAEEDRTGVVVTGVLRDEAGSVRAHADVQACSSSVCLFGETDAAGRFRFPLPPAAAPFVIKTLEDLSSMPRRAAALAPVHLDGRPEIDMGPVYVPRLPEGRVVGAGAGSRMIEAGDGLELTVVPADLVPLPGKVVVSIGARRIPDDQVPAYDLPGGEAVVAVYALQPFAVTSRTPVAVRAESTVPPGTAVWFRSVREIDGTLSSPVAGGATGSHVATLPGEGIVELTHLVITRRVPAYAIRSPCGILSVAVGEPYCYDTPHLQQELSR